MNKYLPLGTIDKFVRGITDRLGIKQACGGLDTGHTQAVIFEALDKQAAEIDRLREAEAILLDMVKSMNGGWQPIETAPKNDQTFLVFCATIDEDRNAYEICSTWGLRNGIFAGDLVPTHWLSLPKPPTA